MPRLRYCGKDENGKSIWINVRDAEIERARRRSAQAIQDTVDPFMSHATDEGLMFDSMSAYKRHLAEHGFEIAGKESIGNKPVGPDWYKVDMEKMRADVQEGMRRVKWGMEPFTEKEKEICRKEAEKMR